MRSPRRNRWICQGCEAEGRLLVLGAVRGKRDARVLMVLRGNKTLVTDAATVGDWIVVCGFGHSGIWHGEMVVFAEDGELSGESDSVVVVVTG